MTKAIFLILMLLACWELRAEPFQNYFRYGTYGLVAGAMAGGTSMAISEDPGSHLTPVARGASLGLYAGLLVAVLKNMGEYKEPKYEILPISVGKESDQGFGIAFYRRF
jgi:hypothetical protein